MLWSASLIAAERSEKLRTEKFSSIAGIGNFRNCFNNAIRKSQMEEWVEEGVRRRETEMGSYQGCFQASSPSHAEMSQ